MTNADLAEAHLKGKDFDDLARDHGLEKIVVTSRVFDYLLRRHGLTLERIQTMSDEERRALGDKINPLPSRWLVNQELAGNESDLLASLRC